MGARQQRTTDFHWALPGRERSWRRLAVQPSFGGALRMFLAQTQPSTPPAPVRIRGRSVMALVVTPEAPLAAWFAALDAQLEASSLLLERPVAADLSLARETVGAEGASILLEGLEARGLKLVAVEGVAPSALAGTRWERLAQNNHAGGRPARELPDLSAVGNRTASGLTVARPVRSGQIVMFEAGDVTIIGGVASGAEVIAGGSIHIYGPLRGRAIAGVRIGDAARIFCRRLEAEMIGVGRRYRTAEDWGAGLQGLAVQAWCDRGTLKLAALD
jgi:septum site-determining protein MinC